MEQTTDGTISYRLSISWSHRSTSSPRPSSWPVDVMMAQSSGGDGRSGGLEGGARLRERRTGSGALGRSNVPIRREVAGEEAAEWERKRESGESYYRFLIASADRAVRRHYATEKKGTHITGLTITAADETTA